MTGRRAGLTALVLAALLAGAARGAPAPARVVPESEVRERLEAGESPGEVVQYFVDRYGEWILLSPRRSGFNLLVWAAPLAAVAVGLAIVSVRVRRWAREPASSGTAPPVDPAMRERIRRETEAER